MRARWKELHRQARGSHQEIGRFGNQLECASQMPQSQSPNIIVAHHLTQNHGLPLSLMHKVLEIAEAIVLAAVAIATAWSGYQAALWTGRQAEQYGLSSRLRVQAEGLEIQAGQERFYSASTVVEWLKAEVHKERELADLLERRFLPEFLPVFNAWKKTDPLNNPAAPPGPTFMPEYHNSKADEAARLNKRAADFFEQGNMARRHSDDYVRVTVTLATVLLLTAISQRFKIHVVRLGIAGLAIILLCFPIYRIFTLPRA
jgi:hypothetical protein